MLTLNGRIDRISYHDAGSGFTVARLVLADTRRTVTVVGNIQSPAAGEEVKITGRWHSHPRFGRQFRIETIESRLPETDEGIKSYLASGLIKGIGAAAAENIVKKFGRDTFTVIEKTPQKLTAVEGIGAAKASAIHEQWQSLASCRAITAFLQENGLNGSYAEKIFSRYGHEALEILQSSPYRLSDDIPEIGFAAADRIAKNIGMEAEGSGRAQACIRHIFRKAADDGHVFMPESDLLDCCSRLYELLPEDALDAVNELLDTGELKAEEVEDSSGGRRLYPKSLYDAEASIAERISAMASLPVDPPSFKTLSLQELVHSCLAVELSSEQISALEAVLANRAVVITGGPGTGKTTLVRSIAAVFKKTGGRICLAAPTGRAARRLTEITGFEAHTIHKLLGYSFEDGLFRRGRDNPVDAEIIVIDEASMVDIRLMHHLMKAVPLNSRLVVVGDAFQLPPIGPGSVLADLIDSDVLPVCRLNRIFRQAGESVITTNAHLVREGEQPELTFLDESNPAESEFYFWEEEDSNKIPEKICRLCAEVLPERFGLDPFKSVQVLSPMHKGASGTINLNQKLQAVLNPEGCLVAGPGSSFKAGDKVMNLRNNYQKDVYNGDIGTIVNIEPGSPELFVDFEGRRVSFSAEEIQDLTLGYAISVHKSQGSEYPAVILPLVTGHYVLLQRNLLYTAVTRARSMVVLIGSLKALSVALASNKPGLRLSGLSRRLKPPASR